MRFNISNRTAALTGLWSGVGAVVLFDFWIPREKPATVVFNHGIEFFLLAVFFCLPSYLFVAGGPSTFAEAKLQWFLNWTTPTFTKPVMLRWWSYSASWIATFAILSGLLRVLGIQVDF